jgi:hypothetical protein
VNVTAQVSGLEAPEQLDLAVSKIGCFTNDQVGTVGQLRKDLVKGMDQRNQLIILGQNIGGSVIEYDSVDTIFKMILADRLPKQAQLVEQDGERLRDLIADGPVDFSDW